MSLYEEIGEAEGKPQGEEDQGVARCNGRCVCSSGGEPRGGALEDQQEGAADHRGLGYEESVGYGEGRIKPMRANGLPDSSQRGHV